jgi:hypothetical protein
MRSISCLGLWVSQAACCVLHDAKGSRLHGTRAVTSSTHRLTGVCNHISVRIPSWVPATSPSILNHASLLLLVGYLSPWGRQLYDIIIQQGRIQLHIPGRRSLCKGLVWALQQQRKFLACGIPSLALVISGVYIYIYIYIYIQEYMFDIWGKGRVQCLMVAVSERKV